MGNPYTNSGEPDLRDLKGNLWRVEKDCWIDTGILNKPFRIFPLPEPGKEVDLLATSLTHRDGMGRYYVKAGYICDGSSIPFFGRWLDARTSAWPGIIHDINQEAFRAKELPLADFNEAAELYGAMLHAFGAWSITASLCVGGLKVFGHASASPENGPEYPHRVARSKAA